MTHRTIETIQADMDQALRDENAARQRRMRLSTEMAAARTAEAEAAPHPLAGKLVRREVSRGYDRQKVTQTGTVTLQGTVHRSLINHRPKPGEWFVLSQGGRTGYVLGNDWREA